MSRIFTKLLGITNCTKKTTIELIDSTVYGSKVLFEICKNVYKTEKLGPPPFDEFKRFFSNTFEFVTNKNLKQELLFRYLNFRTSKEKLIKYFINTIEIAGFFTVGEIIGRGKIYGYPKLGSANH